MFRNVMNKFSNFINSNAAVIQSAPIPTADPVPEVSYPFVTDFINDGWDYSLPRFIKDANSLSISGYPVEDLGGATSREITFADGVTAETTYFFSNACDADVTAEFTYDEYELFANALRHCF